MSLPLYTEAIITRDIPEEGLRRGDSVVLLDHLVSYDGTEGYAVEVHDAPDRRCPVAIVPPEVLRLLDPDEAPNAQANPGT